MNSLALCLILSSPSLPPKPYQDLAREILRELVETDTTHAKGSRAAAEGLARRLVAAGFPQADVQVLGQRPEKGNLVARYEWTLNNWDAHVQGALVHTGSIYPDLRIRDRAVTGKQPAFTTFDLSFGVEADGWRVEAYAKKLRKAVEEYEKIGKADEVAKLKSEIAIVEEYVPKKASAGDTEALVDAFLKDKTFTEKQLGQAMGQFMKAHGGQVDPGVANAALKAKLAGK